MDYQETLDYLKNIELIGIKPELETCRTLVAHLPLDRELTSIKFIQVAGTNGKGSTSHFLASILRAGGVTVGLFTSPHLWDIRERIVIDNQMVAPDLFAESITEIRITAQKLLQKGIIERMPTYFEYTFLAALYCFARLQVQVAVLEVGMGGRWDATSVITPQVAVITTISHDHTAILGKRIGDIAAEKAGIIKDGVPIVCGHEHKNIAFRVIKDIAQKHNAPFFRVTDRTNKLAIKKNYPPYYCTYKTFDSTAAESTIYSFTVLLNGKHQTLNAATAIKALRVFTASARVPFTFTAETIKRGIIECRVPGRIEIFDSFFPPVILDGAHNVQSITALTQFLKDRNKKNLTLIFGVLADKNFKQIVDLLLPYVSHVILTPPLSPRALPSLELINFFGKSLSQQQIFVRSTPEDAFNTARTLNNEILITGSFYLVGISRHILLKTLSHERRNIRNPE